MAYRSISSILNQARRETGKSSQTVSTDSRAGSYYTPRRATTSGSKSPPRPARRATTTARRATTSSWKWPTGVKSGVFNIPMKLPTKPGRLVPLPTVTRPKPSSPRTTTPRNTTRNMGATVMTPTQQWNIAKQRAGAGATTAQIAAASKRISANNPRSPWYKGR